MFVKVTSVTCMLG